MQRSGDELKLVYPQEEIEPTKLEGLDFAHFLLQPMDQGGRRRLTMSGGDRLLSRPSQMAAQHSGA